MKYDNKSKTKIKVFVKYLIYIKKLIYRFMLKETDNVNCEVRQRDRERDKWQGKQYTIYDIL